MTNNPYEPPEGGDENVPPAGGWRDRIIRAAVLVAIAHFLVKVVSLIQNRYLGEFFGPEERDFFVTIYKVVFMSIFLVGEETLGPIFLPVFMKIRKEAGEAAAWRFSSVIFNCYFLILVVIGVVMILDPLLVIRIWTKWADNPEAHAQQLDLARRTVPILVPGLIGMCLGSLTYLLLNSRERFFWAAWGDGMVKVCILGGILIGGLAYSDEVNQTLVTGGLAIAIAGITAGGLAKLACHLCALGKSARQYRFTLATNGRYIKEFLVLMLPLLVGILFAKFRDGFNHSWVLSDHEGLIAANAFGKTIADSIHYLVPYAVSIALLPYFCMLAEDRDDKKFASILGHSTRSLLFLFVPISLIIMVVAFPLTRGFYETGKFTLLDSRLTAMACSIFVIGLVFTAVEAVFMQAFFSRRSIWTPILIGIVCSSLSILISYVGIVRFNIVNPFHVLAIATGGYVLSRAIKSIVLGAILQRRIHFFDWGEARRALKSICIGGSVAFAVAYGLLSGFDALIGSTDAIRNLFETIPKSLRYLALSGGIGSVAFFAFFAASCRCGLEEPRWLYEWSIEKYPAIKKLKLDRIMFGETID
jgi:putative peptidoglycan lipid II flippase